MRLTLPRSRLLCILALGACLAGAATPLCADEDVKPVVIEGKLAKDDPRDAVRKGSGHKVHEVKMEAGKCYQIDLASKDFDPFLRLEDANKKQLGFNDDIDYAAKILDARLCLPPLQTGTYRLIVTSFEGAATGAYQLRVQALAEVGKPVLEERRLGKESQQAKGRYFELRPLTVATGEARVLEAGSKEFAPRLLLVDDKGTQILDGVVHEQNQGVARVSLAALRPGRYQVLVTAQAEGATGAYSWRVATYRSTGSLIAGKDKVDRAMVLAAYKQANALKKQARLAEAVAAYERVVRLAQEALGPDHRDTATYLNNLALLYQDQGEYGKAEPLFQRSLAIVESQLGKDHPNVASSLNNLAALYRAQEQYGKAEPLLLRSLAIRESKLGKDHPNVASSLNNLAALYREQGQYRKAEPLLLRSLAIWERKPGKDHPSVALSLNNLAVLYREQGQYGKAEPLLLRGLAIVESKLGKDHPSVAISLSSLALLYQAQAQSGKAEPLLLRSLAIRESKLGKDHPDVAISLNNLAALYQDQGQYGKGEPLYQRSLAIRERKLGKDHTDVAVSLNNLAGLYRAQGQYGKAEPLLLRSLAIWESKLGKDHPNVAISLNNLAALYREEERYGKAEPLLLRSLAIRESKLGKDHPDVAGSLNNLAELDGPQGQYGKAEPLLLRSLAIRESKLGKDHPNVASSLNNLAALYRAQGHYGKGEPLYQRSLAIWESKLGKDHAFVATSLNNLALLYAAQERWEPAREALDRARRSLRRHLGRELAALPERDQLTFLRTQVEGNYHAALSLGWLQRDQQALRRASGAWLVNGQALAHEALAEQILLQRDSAGQRWAPLAAELHALRRQLAALALHTPPPAQLDTHRRRLAGLADREEALARRVAQESGRGAGAAWRELDALRKELPADSALIALARFDVFNFKATRKEPLWGPPRYAAWVIAAKDVQLIDLGAAADIEQEVLALGKELSARRAVAAIKSEGEPDAEKLLRRHLDKVAQRVLQPLLPHLKGKARWLVCPDGALWLVPWAALTLPDGKYVVERHTVSCLVSGRDVFPLDSKAKASAPVMLADPDFDLTPGKQAGGKSVPGEDADDAATRSVPLGAVHFGRLPGTAAEAKAIAPKLRAYAGAAAKVYSGAAATEAAFKALRGPKVLVLSTHGFFLPDVERMPADDFLGRQPKRPAPPEENPLLRNGLVLAGANERAAAAKAGVDDGILTALEILGTDLRGTELVVLSACETGLGEVRNGEGVAGLRQAFQLAGAQSVVASLWQVPDRQTAQLMGKFFDQLAAGRGRAEALRLAQLEMIRARRQREGAAHPFFWAAFTLTGNWR